MRTMRTIKTHLLGTLFIVVLFFIFQKTQAQDNRNPWLISIGPAIFDVSDGQAVDYVTTKDFQIAPISYFSLYGYLFAGVSFGFDFSYNKFKATDEPLLKYTTIDKLSIGVSFQYSLNKHILKKGWFDPYISVGANFLSLGKVSTKTPSITASGGFNIWFTKHMGLKIQSGFIGDYFSEVKLQNTTTSETETVSESRLGSTVHFQHLIGIAVRLGPKDLDEDGIIDKKDRCPKDFGLTEFEGCPDTDRDKIPDIDDKCPKVKGVAQFEGCPDTDKDGIQDSEDKCPVIKGVVEFKGCPDTDKDGIQDSEDKCPTEAGPAKNKGCPEDTDKDGIPDIKDLCPKEKGTLKNSGCPPTYKKVEDKLKEKSTPNKKQSGKAIGEVVTVPILFGVSSYYIKKISTEIFDELANKVKDNGYSLLIKGYTDTTGRFSLNQVLSFLRAKSVARQLIRRGVPKDKIILRGYGENHKADNSTKVARGRNRRVDMQIITSHLDPAQDDSQYAYY